MYTHTSAEEEEEEEKKWWRKRETVSALLYWHEDTISLFPFSQYTQKKKFPHLSFTYFFLLAPVDNGYFFFSCYKYFSCYPFFHLCRTFILQILVCFLSFNILFSCSFRWNSGLFFSILLFCFILQRQAKHFLFLKHFEHLRPLITLKESI